MTDETTGTTETDPRIGMVLQERYSITRLLGAGGMGAVYEGEHVLIKRRVAIKCLHAQFATNPQIVARFHREALAATSIGNEHIIEVTDMGRFPDGAVFMVLEFLDGKDFAKAITDTGAMPLGRVVHIATQVCEALAAAHAKGIVHRDLKPENVFLIQRGGDEDFVKVLDFGISKFKDEDGVSSMTRTGARMGTPYYMSPEQAEGRRDVDSRADIYALGVMLFRALTGVYPFDDDSFPMLILKICTAPPPSLKHYRPDLPGEIEGIIHRMLAKKREDRYATCDEIRVALAPFRAVTLAPNAADIAARVLNAPPMQTNASLLMGASTSASHVATPAGMALTGSDRTIDPVAVPEAIAPRKQASPVWAIGGGMLVAAAAVIALRVAGVIGVSHPNDRPVAAPPPVIAQASAAPVPVTQAALPAPSAPVPTVVPEALPTPAEPDSDQTVRVQIHAVPDDAELFLDGSRIANPFDGELPVSTVARHVEARLNGYRSYLQDLDLHFAQRVSIHLHHGDGVEDHRAAHPTTTAPTVPAAAPSVPAAQAAPTAPVAPAPAHAAEEAPNAAVITPPASAPLRPSRF